MEDADVSGIFSDLVSVDVTVNNINDDPTGSVTITGIKKIGQLLTADASTLADADNLTGSMPAITYQWQSSTDGSIWNNITSETNSTYTLTDDEIGDYVRVSASYTDEGSKPETVTSSSTSAITDVLKLIQVRDPITLTAAEASVEINASDYSSGSTDSVLKFDLYFDAEGIDTLNASVSEILGAEFNFSWDELQLDDVAAFASEENTDWLMDFSADSILTVSQPNNKTGAMTVGKASAIVDIDAATDRIPMEKFIGTIYMNPKDGVSDIQITLENMVIATDGDDVAPLDYTVDIL